MQKEGRANMGMVCPNCGAQAEFSPDNQMLVCSYCNTQSLVKINESIPAGGSIQADYIVPHNLNKKSLKSHTMAYMVSGDYTPDDIVDISEIVNEELYYVPAYMTIGQFEANWTASFGFDRQEAYTDYEKDSSGHRKAVTKYRTVTDWRPASGTANGSFGASAYAGQMITDPSVVEAVEELCFDRQEMNLSYLSGYEVEPFALTISQVKATLAQKVENIVGAAVHEHAQGDRQKDWHWNSKLDVKEDSTVYLPVGHSIFTYKGGEYHVWVASSQANQTIVLGSNLPQDTQRGFLVKLGYLPAVTIALACALFYFILQHDRLWYINWQAFVAIFIAIFFGYFRGRNIIDFSKKIRDSSLAKKKLADTNIDQNSEEHRNLLEISKIPKQTIFMKRLWDDSMLIAVTLSGITAAFIYGAGWIFL
jgi:DNA-directed RNA polymerase subunit RPC12/RpoP